MSLKNPSTYLLCTPHGPLTVHEEYFCWIFAVTGKYRMSRRMAYGNERKGEMNDKLRGRVADLLDMHNKLVIDLAKGPWSYYGFDIGDPTRYIRPLPKDYAECLT